MPISEPWITKIFMIERGEAEDYAQANRAFHLAIYAGAHNGVLLDLAVGLRRRLDPFRRAQFRASGRLAKSHHEHDLVVRAILSGDCAGAHARMLFARLRETAAARNSRSRISPSAAGPGCRESCCGCP